MQNSRKNCSYFFSYFRTGTNTKPAVAVFFLYYFKNIGEFCQQFTELLTVCDLWRLLGRFPLFYPIDQRSFPAALQAHDHDLAVLKICLSIHCHYYFKNQIIFKTCVQICFRTKTRSVSTPNE